MADGITLNVGSGGATLATDDIGGTHYQIVKLGLGALDSLTLLDGNSGNKSAGTLRVVLATDQPALTNKLLVTPDLPSGASTAAKQPALGTAGSASTDVISVQGIASMTPILATVTLAAGATAIAKAEDAASANADVGVPAMAIQLATPADLAGTDADYAMLQMSGGRVWVSAKIDTALPAGTNGIGKLTANSGVTIGAVEIAAAQTLATVTTVSTVTNLSQMGGQAIALNTGTRSAGTQRVTIATDDIVPASQSGTWTVQPGNTANTTPWLVQDVPAISGGLSTFMASGSDGSSILVATAQAVKASAGQLYGYYVSNPEASKTYLHFYNTAQGSVTVGTTNPLFSLEIPAGSAANVSLPQGVAFGTAITVAATTTAGGNTAPSTGLSLVCWYK